MLNAFTISVLVGKIRSNYINHWNSVSFIKHLRLNPALPSVLHICIDTSSLLKLLTLILLHTAGFFQCALQAAARQTEAGGHPASSSAFLPSLKVPGPPVGRCLQGVNVYACVYIVSPGCPHFLTLAEPARCQMLKCFVVSCVLRLTCELGVTRL